MMGLSLDTITKDDITCDRQDFRLADRGLSNLTRAASRNTPDNVIQTIRDALEKDELFTANFNLANIARGILDAAEILHCKPSLKEVLAHAQASDQLKMRELAAHVEKILNPPAVPEVQVTIGGGDVASASAQAPLIVSTETALTGDTEGEGVGREYLKGITVLVVDDESGMQDASLRLLTSRGATCQSADNGADGFDKAVKLPPGSIILMDFLMPGLSGIEAAKKIKEVCPDIKIILYSAGGATLRIIVEAMGEGIIDRFIKKPAEGVDDLARAIKSLVT